MKKHHNLGTVIAFEFIRTIKKPSFWIATLSLPLLFVVLFAIIFYSGQSAMEKSAELSEESFSIAYLDESNLINKDLATQTFEAEVADDFNQSLDQVRTGDLDALFVFPESISQDPIKIYGKDAGLFDNSKYTQAAQAMLQMSAAQIVGDEQVLFAVKGATTTDMTTFTEDGEKASGWLAAIPPLLFLVLFYMAIAMLGNNLLNSTVEEKENRVTEMIVTTINPTDLIVGKLIATLGAGIVQALVILIPVVGAYLFLGSGSEAAASIGLPDLSMLSDLVIDPVTMLVGLLIFIGGLAVFTGLLVAIGAVMPTAKEAGQYFGIVIILLIVPFYIFQLILSDPESTIVQVMTYFPLTAPVTAMLRNAFGSLDPTAATIVIAMLLILGAVIIRLAVQLFRYGAMQYDSKLSLSSIRQRKETSKEQ